MNKQKYNCLFLIIIILMFVSIIYTSLKFDEISAADENTGIIIKEVAKAAGVEEKDPLINTDKGDLLLFVFCFSGLIAGFALGHSWKDISTAVSPKEIDIDSIQQI